MEMAAALPGGFGSRDGFGAEAAQELSSCREQRSGEEGNGNSLCFGLGEKSCDSPFLHL